MQSIDWELQPGEHWAVLGGNGAGKTSFLRLLAGELWPAPGGQRSYDFGQGPETDAVDARRLIRLVTPELQDRYVRRRWNLRARDFVATGFSDSPILRTALTAEQRETLAKTLQRLGLTAFANRRLLALSRGEQRRLLLARALVSAPRLLLLDEVCDGLDEQVRQQLLADLERLSADGLQLIFATHYADERPGCIRRSLTLAAGRIARLDDLPPVKPTLIAAAAKQPAVAGEALIEISRADLYRGSRRVLQDINWQIRAGQRWLVQGPNGSGKSSLIRLLNAELRPALGGSIRWFALPEPPNVWQLRRRLGLVSDELQAIYTGRLSVRDCVATGLNASIGRVPPGAATSDAVATALQAVHAETFAKRPIQSLSYGQFRRVLLARALVQAPDLLLLDEAFSGLDAAASRQFIAILELLVERGVSLVLASHRLPATMDIFTHHLRLADGRLDFRVAG